MIHACDSSSRPAHQDQVDQSPQAQFLTAHPVRFHYAVNSAWLYRKPLRLSALNLGPWCKVFATCLACQHPGSGCPHLDLVK